eukprot:2181226-Prymnesium_polylepis.1
MLCRERCCAAQLSQQHSAPRCRGVSHARRRNMRREVFCTHRCPSACPSLVRRPVRPTTTRPARHSTTTTPCESPLRLCDTATTAPCSLSTHHRSARNPTPIAGWPSGRRSAARRHGRASSCTRATHAADRRGAAYGARRRARVLRADCVRCRDSHRWLSDSHPLNAAATRTDGCRIPILWTLPGLAPMA